MSEVYTFDIASGTLQGVWDRDRLWQEVANSPQLPDAVLEELEEVGSDIRATFAAALSAEESEYLTYLVSQHSGEPLDTGTDLTPQQYEAVVAASEASGDNPVATQADIASALVGLTWRRPVLDKDVDAPPGSPASGDRYLLVGTPSGAWAGHQGEIAEWDGEAWAFTVPVDGMVVVVNDEDTEYHQTESEAPWVWEDKGGGQLPIHGNEKHSSSYLTMGGNRSDANLDKLLGGASSTLHTHPGVHSAGGALFDTAQLFFGSLNFSRGWKVICNFPLAVSGRLQTGFKAFYSVAAVFDLSGGGAEWRLVDAETGDVIGVPITATASGISLIDGRDFHADFPDKSWVQLQVQVRKTTAWYRRVQAVSLMIEQRVQ